MRPPPRPGKLWSTTSLPLAGEGGAEGRMRERGQASPVPALLAEPDQALFGYLQCLLDELPPDPLPAAPERALSVSLQLQPPPVSMPELAMVSAPVVPIAALTPAIRGGTEERVPLWGTQAFQVLEFEAAGRTLATPLVGLSSIVRLEGTLTRLPGSSPWHLGIQRVRGHKVRVIDVARLLFPWAAATPVPRRGYVLVLDDGAWGLACTGLGSAIRVEAGAVRWRRTQGHPALICGVLPDRLLPLLDGTDILAALGQRPGA